MGIVVSSSPWMLCGHGEQEGGKGLIKRGFHRGEGRVSPGVGVCSLWALLEHFRIASGAAISQRFILLDRFHLPQPC